MFLREPECEVHVLNGLAGGAFAEVVDRAEDLHDAVAQREGIVQILSALDNLGKGAAGQAVQNMNLMLGLPEEYGLDARTIVG